MVVLHIFFSVFIFTRVAHSYLLKSQIFLQDLVPGTVIPYPIISSSELPLSILWADSFGIRFRISKQLTYTSYILSRFRHYPWTARHGIVGLAFFHLSPHISTRCSLPCLPHTPGMFTLLSLCKCYSYIHFVFPFTLFSYVFISLSFSNSSHIV